MLFALVPVAFVSLVVPDLFFSNFGTDSSDIPA
jgi:hypothetical protein